MGTATHRPDHYTYRIHWLGEDQAYTATVADLPSLSWLDEERSEAFAGIQRLVADVMRDLAASGEPVPEAIADRH